MATFHSYDPAGSWKVPFQSPSLVSKVEVAGRAGRVPVTLGSRSW